MPKVLTTSELTPVAGMSQQEMQLHERARKAYREAQFLLRDWRNLARMMSRRPDLQVELTAGPSRTDNKTIFIAVPMELGNDLVHESGLCGKRNDQEILVCEKCAILEDVNIIVIHEVAHLVGGTFETIQPEEITRIIVDTIRLEYGSEDSPRAKWLRERLEKAPLEIRQQYMGIANNLSPFLPLLVNACEDIRVNTLMQQERPGTKRMFRAQLNKVFGTGVLGPDGTYTRWIDTPPNAQALIGIYCMTWDLSLEGKILPEIIEKLDDPEIHELVLKMQTSRSIREIYKTSFPLMEALRRLGFLRFPDEQPEEDKSDSNNQGENDGDQNQENTSQDVQNSDQSGNSKEPDFGDSKDESGSSDSNSSGSKSGDSEHQTPETGLDQGHEKQEQDSEQSNDSSNSRGNDPGDSSEESSPESSEQSSSSSGGSEPSSESPDTTVGPPDSGADDQPTHTPTPSDSVPNSDGKDTGDSGNSDSLEYTYQDMEQDGLPELVQRLFDIFGGHADKYEDEDSREEELAKKLLKKVIEITIEQIDDFDRPSKKISGLELFKYPQDAGARAWEKDYYYSANTDPVKIPEGILVGSLQRLRLLFQDNARGKTERNLRSGKVNARALARRVPIGDDRVFQKHRLPGRKDWFVVVGLDCSGSTARNIDYGKDSRLIIDLIKTVAFAKAELLHRLGIPFAVYAHSGGDQTVDLFAIKEANQPWNSQAKQALFELQPYSANLDGHSLEFYRKVAERYSATDKLILYYTDGAMPAENFAEELAILQQEIKTCRKLGIHLVGVGVQSDAPLKHGLDTILINHLEEVGKVITELRRRLSA